MIHFLGLNILVFYKPKTSHILAETPFLELYKAVCVEQDEFKNSKNFDRAIKKSNGNDTLLIGDDMQKIDYLLARCCTPIPGDDVFGFLTVTEGIKIHRSSCPNAKQLLSSYGNRVIKAMWASQVQKSYVATISIVGIDRVGMIQELTNVISNQLHTNMRSLNIDTDEQIFHGNIKVYVTDTKHLDKLLKNLKNIEGMNKVVRKEQIEEEIIIK